MSSSSASSRRDFLAQAASLAAVASTGLSLTACGGGDDDGSNPSPATFQYGVASGDPLSDRIILWTHARVTGSTASVPLKWEVATDSTFATVVASGRTSATADTGFTVKVDATGLTAGTAYVYRFVDDTGAASPVGTTRTLPAAGVASVKLAVFSCALYPAGFFNAYEAAAQTDAQYAVHLGDYVYEYGAGTTQYGNTNAVALGRVVQPANDMVSLDDYRTRYAQYRSDAQLQALHAKMPWIVVWDDHEFANNAWVGGAENHDSATQGDWLARKAIAARVWHEWLPVRTPDTSDLLKIYRRFDFGSLLTLHMLDTRIEGRDRQYDNYGDTDGGLTRYATALATGTDAGRRMMSATQQSWLTSGLTASSATWQVLGNQDIMARMWFPASVLTTQATGDMAATQTAVSAYLTAKATRFAAGASALTPAQAALLDTTTNPLLPYNLDAWDGYPSQRETILQTVKASGKRLVTLSGDSHNAWFAKVTTLAGDTAGWEFAGTSVSSPGFESVGLGALAGSLDGSALSTQLGSAAVGAGLGLVNDLTWCDTTRRGFLLMTFTADAVRGEYRFVNTVASRTYTSEVGQTVTVSSGGTVSMG